MALVAMAFARALDRPPQIEVAAPGFQPPQMPNRPKSTCAPTLQVGNADGQIQVQWTAVPVVTHYTVRLRQVGSSQWMLFDAATQMLVESGGKAVVAPETQCTVPGLAMDQLYEAVISARSDVGWIDVSPVSPPCGWPKPQKPNRPQAICSGPDSIRVNWEPLASQPKVIAYSVRCRSQNGAWKFFDAGSKQLVESGGLPLSSAERECWICRLAKDCSYEISISAKSAVGWGEWSEPSAPLRIAVPPTPLAPTLQVGNEDGQIQVQWTAVQATPAVKRYTVHFRQVGSSKWMLFDAATQMLVESGGKAVAATATQVTVAGLAMDQVYEASVSARNDVGWSDDSPVSPPCGWPKPQKLNRPQAICSGPDSIRVNWEPLKSQPKVIAYSVRCRSQNGAWKFFDAGSKQLVESGGLALTSAVSECWISGLAKKRYYETAVRAKNAAGWGEWSEPSAPTRIAVPATPLAPTLQVGNEAGQIQVQWTAVQATPVVTDYTVHFRQVGSSKWMLFDAATQMLVESGGKAVAATATQVTVAGLAMDQVYEASVSARNDVGWSDDSPVSPPCGWSKPGTPRSPEVVVVSGRGKIRVTWEPARWMPPVLHYRIKVREVGSRAWMVFDHISRALVQSNATAVPAAETQCEVDDLRGHYEVCLCAQNAAGWSDGSDPSNIYVPRVDYHALLHSHPEGRFQTDVVSLAAALNGSGRYRVRVAPGTTAQTVIADVQHLASVAHPDDVVLYGFSGHGGEYNNNDVDGVVLKLNGSSLPATVLADELSRVRSRKMVVIIHACFAGRFPVLQSLHNVGSDPGSHETAEFAHMMHERSGKIVIMAGHELTYGNCFWSALTAKINDAHESGKDLHCFELFSWVVREVQKEWNDRHRSRAFHPLISAHHAHDFPLLPGADV